MSTEQEVIETQRGWTESKEQNAKAEESTGKLFKEINEQEWTEYLKKQQELLFRIIDILERNYGVCEMYKLEASIPEVLDTAIAIGIAQGFIEAKANGVTLSSKHLADVNIDAIATDDIPEDKAERIAYRTSWAFLKSFVGLDNKVHYRIRIPSEATIILRKRGLIGQRTLLDFL